MIPTQKRATCAVCTGRQGCAARIEGAVRVSWRYEKGDRTENKRERKKACAVFSTCSSHLCLFPSFFFLIFVPYAYAYSSSPTLSSFFFSQIGLLQCATKVAPGRGFAGLTLGFVRDESQVNAARER